MILSINVLVIYVIRFFFLFKVLLWNLPEDEGVFSNFHLIYKLFKGQKQTLLEIGFWDMDFLWSKWTLILIFKEMVITIFIIISIITRLSFFVYVIMFMLS